MPSQRGLRDHADGEKKALNSLQSLFETTLAILRKPSPDLVGDMTMAGTVFTAASILVAFWVYRRTMRDSDTARLQTQLSIISSIAEELRQMDAGMQLDDMSATAASVVYSREMGFPLKRGYRAVRGREKLSNEQLAAVVQGFPVIQVPVKVNYENALSRIDIELARVPSDFPALYNVLDSVATELRNSILTITVEAARKPMLESVLQDVLNTREGQPYSELEHFMYDMYVGLSEKLWQQFASDHQPKITDLLTIMNGCVGAYMRKPRRDLIQLRRRELRERICLSRGAMEPGESLREAQKGLRHVLTQGEMADVRELTQRVAAYS